MSALATVLSCSMTLVKPVPALANESIVLNLRVPDDTAAQIASGVEPAQPVVFEGEAGAAPGWVIQTAGEPGGARVAINRITLAPALSLRQGQADRLADGRYRFEEYMRGPCKLVAESDLK